MVIYRLNYNCFLVFYREKYGYIPCELQLYSGCFTERSMVIYCVNYNCFLVALQREVWIYTV